MCGYLTPREHLRFMGINVLSHKMSREKIYGLVEEVMREVRLGKW